MIQIRKSADRGQADYGWLKSYHTFSFGSYRDYEHMGYRVLRVINEDRVLADKGFGTHPHDNMEIISYVVSGELEHKDSMGNGSVINEGEFQVITAGTGIAHSEFNPSKDQETHFYQIWIIPDAKNLEPAYGQRKYQKDVTSQQLELVACKFPTNGELKVNQDMKLYLVRIGAGEAINLPIQKERYGWVQVVSGRLDFEGEELYTGDGLAFSDFQNPTLKANEEIEILFFDLP